MGKADALSRMTGLETGEKDNENVTLLKPEYFISNLVIESPEDEIIDLIKKQKINMDKYVQTRLDLKDQDWTKEDDIILFRNWI